jgi:HPt (histidine-containing phosphotransfer) domain-containing protein
MINQMAVFNRELALDRVGGDEELLEEIVGLFLGEYPGLLEQIQSAVSLGDAQALHRSAHTLKGSLAALGAEAAQQQAHELEISGRLGQLNGAPSMLTDLENLLGQLRQELGR